MAQASSTTLSRTHFLYRLMKHTELAPSNIQKISDLPEDIMQAFTRSLGEIVKWELLMQNRITWEPANPGMLIPVLCHQKSSHFPEEKGAWAGGKTGEDSPFPLDEPHPRPGHV